MADLSKSEAERMVIAAKPITEVRELIEKAADQALPVFEYGKFNRQKTHCKHGHEYTPDNTYNPPGSSQRMCLKCSRQRSHHKATKKVRITA